MYSFFVEHDGELSDRCVEYFLFHFCFDPLQSSTSTGSGAFLVWVHINQMQKVLNKLQRVYYG